MKRRDFLSLLGTGLVGALAAKPAELLYQPGLAEYFLPTPAITSELGVNVHPLAWMTLEFARLVGEYAPAQFTTDLTVKSKMGEEIQLTGRAPVIVSDLQWVEMEDPKPMQGVTDPEQAFRDRYVLPAAQAVVHAIRHQGITVYARPDKVSDADACHIVVNRLTGVAARGIRVFDPYDMRYRVRLDILGARAA
jgi:hypothetical protein